MYDRQRVVFNLYCTNKTSQQRRTQSAAEREVVGATRRELRRAKAFEYHSTMQTMLALHQSILVQHNPHNSHSLHIPHTGETKESVLQETGSGGGGLFVDRNFEGARAIYENPISPSSTLDGKELSRGVKNFYYCNNRSGSTHSTVELPKTTTTTTGGKTEGGDKEVVVWAR